MDSVSTRYETQKPGSNLKKKKNPDLKNPELLSENKTKYSRYFYLSYLILVGSESLSDKNPGSGSAIIVNIYLVLFSTLIEFVGSKR